MAIVTAAVARFVADGFQRTSMADVARDVGLSPSAVYRYFPTKEALFIAAVEEHPLAARALTGVEPMSPDRIMALPHLAELRRDLVALLQVGQEHGAVRADIPAKTLALGVETIVLYQMAHLASLRGVDTRPDDERWDAIATVLEAAIRPGGG